MEIDKVYDVDVDVVLLPPTERPSYTSHFLDSFWISKSSPSFQGDSASGSTSMVNFKKSSPGGLLPPLDKEESGNDEYDPCLHQAEKKRRLTVDQVKFLEKSFEVENKLEPERKVQLAKDLGLQARQVAIWFQNRRARYKTKQLEKDYDSLKANYDKLKVDYDSLSEENEKLRLEVESLKEKVGVVEKKRPAAFGNKTNSVDKETTEIKQEDANSGKSDVLDSESPHASRVALFEPVDSSRDLSDYEEDEFCRIVPPPCLPKLKIESYDDLTAAADTCNLANSVDDQTFWFWP